MGSSFLIFQEGNFENFKSDAAASSITSEKSIISDVFVIFEISIASQIFENSFLQVFMFLEIRKIAVLSFFGKSEHRSSSLESLFNKADIYY